MSPTSDLRSYADSAMNQGKQTFSTARAQFSGVTDQAGETLNRFTASVLGGARGNASGVADRANDAVSDLRTSTEKVINIDSVRSALEPYVAQLRGYGDSFTDRAEELVATLKRDPRFAKLFETAESLTTAVIEIVQERVVKPARSATSGGPSTPANEPGAAGAA